LRIEKELNGEYSKLHFVEVVNYVNEEPWRTDILFGQRGVDSHGHLALSGSRFWYFRDGECKEIINNGEIVNVGESI